MVKMRDWGTLRAYAKAKCSPKQPHRVYQEKDLSFCGPKGLSLAILLSGYSSLSEGTGPKDQSQGRRDMEGQRQRA